MNSILAFSIGAHLFVLFFAFRFFHTNVRCREADRNIVASLSAASVGFLIAVAVNWWWHYQDNMELTVTDSVFGAFAAFNGILYITLVRGFVQHRDGRCPFTPPGDHP